MSPFAPFAIALRLSGVTIDQNALEQALGLKVSRFEPEDAPHSHYAQVDVDNDNAIRSILWLAAGAGQSVKRLLDARQIGLAVLDIAMDFPEEGETMSTRIPAHVAVAVGSCDIDIELSVYLVDETDDED